MTDLTRTRQNQTREIFRAEAPRATARKTRHDRRIDKDLNGP